MDILTVSENFTTLARALQSGEQHPHSLPLDDVFLEALGKVEREVNEVVEGFQAAVAEVGRRGARIFAEVEEEGTVSILPAEPVETEIPAPGLEEGVEHVFLGRSKEEMEEKLKVAAGVGGDRDEL